MRNSNYQHQFEQEHLFLANKLVSYSEQKKAEILTLSGTQKLHEMRATAAWTLPPQLMNH